jgi:hypothetical protein
MNFSIRRKLDMAGRVRDFCRMHPDLQNAGYTAAVARLEQQLIRAVALADQQVTGHQMVAIAVVNKEKLRVEIHQTIALLAGLAGPAAKEERELAVGILRPDVNGSHQAFLTRCRVAASTGAKHKELLVRYGMPENFLEELNAQLDRYEQALNQQNAGRAAHVGARAELEAVTAEIMLNIQQIAAVVRFRFRSNAESLAVWKSARDIAWPSDKPVVGEPKKPDAGQPENPAA